MPVITLPDGSEKVFDSSISAKKVCENIGSGLAKAMIAAEINGQCADAATLIDRDSSLKIITSTDDKGLEIIRHSTAHLLAHAVKRLYPNAQVTIGPVIEDGFYYDFYYPPGFSENDLEKIEEQMRELVKKRYSYSEVNFV